MDTAQLNTNMIQRQIQTWDVTDPKVIEAFHTIPRDAFAPNEFKNLAYADMEIPLGEHQTMLSPKVEARMLEALDLQPSDRVLEIGTGSGFMAALMSTLAYEVHTVDIHEGFKKRAIEHLKLQKINNVKCHCADAAQGFTEAGKFNVIVITGALPFLPESFKEMLEPNGRLMAILGEGDNMEVVLATLVSPTQFTVKSLFDTSTQPLINAKQPEPFVF